MGLLPTDLRLIIRLHKEVHLEGPVLCLGNQDIWASHSDLRSFFKDEDCMFQDVATIPSTGGLPKLWRWAADWVHAKVFFGMMGIDDYCDVDKYDDEKPTLLHDLNDPVPPSFCNRFGLVVDGGMTEHTFDIKQVLENIVRSLRVGGWVMHFVPSLCTAYVNHGFYGFSPCLYFDYYRVNGFTDFRCFLAEHKSNIPRSYLKPATLRECRELSFGPYSWDTLALNPSRHLGVFFAARKSSSLDICRTPTQGIYDVERRTKDPERTKEAERLVGYWDRHVPKPLRPVLQPFRPFLGWLYWRLFLPKPRQTRL